MATPTTNYNLLKPTTGETYNVQTLNDNYDKIDTALGGHDKQAKGLMWYKASTADPAAVNTTLTVIDSCPSFTFKAGRKYRIGWVSEFTVSVNDTHGEVCIQQAPVGDAVNLTTNLVRFNRHTIEAVSTLTKFFNHAFIHTPASDSTIQVKFTLQQVAGTGTVALTGSAVARPIEFFIEDLGAQF